LNLLLGSRKYSYLTRVCLFLITVVLGAGIAGCSGSTGDNSGSYTITIASTTGGSVTIPGEGTFHYDEGKTVNLTAMAEAGYRFVNWTGQVTSIVSVNEAITAIAIDGNYEITASFEPIPSGPFTLTISSTAGGSVITPGEGVHTYDYGTVVTLLAAPHAGYRFVNWTGHVNSVDNFNVVSATVSIKDNYSIIANFEKIPSIQYDLTISSSAGGTVMIPGTGTFNYDAGTEVNLVAEPAGGFRFTNWIGDVDTIDDVNAASTIITMDDDYSITAEFEWLFS